MNTELTLVSALFDLGRGEIKDEGFRRSFDHYKECFSKLLSQAPQPMILYTTSDLNDFIWQYRSPENTRIINKTLDDLRTFPFYNQVQKIRTNSEWYGQSSWMEHSPQKELELYSITTFHKQFWLNDATLFGHFPSKYYMWIDAGISNTLSPGYFADPEFNTRLIAKLRNNKMLYVGFPYDGTVEIHGFKKSALDAYAGEEAKFVCRGGLFAGSKEIINNINDIYYHLLSDSLNHGYLGTEESVFSIIAHKHKDKVSVQPIESNGLIYKFLEDLKKESLPIVNEHPLAWYFLVFNTPKQFEYTLAKWKAAYPKEFDRVKKYVVNNSNDPSVEADYQKLFQENNMEEFKFDNIGICSGRQFVAEHFDKSTHDYYVFIEEDMGVYEKEKDPALCKNGFQTHHEGLFEKSMEIMESEKLDVLRLTFTEFFGDCMVSWAYINFPGPKKDEYYPPKSGMLATKEYSPETLNKIKVDHHGVYKGLPYAVGNYHVSNWPLMFNKVGNKKVYLDIKWEHTYEQTIMSNAGFLWEEGKLSVGCLLATPILHNRIYHYDGSKRRENHHYKN